jgi:serine protease Do
MDTAAAVRLVFLSTIAAACAAGPGPEPASPSRELTIGGAMAGRLTRSDPKLPGTNRASQTWMFSAQAGQRVIVEMLSTALDAHVILQDSAGAELARDDDGGEGTNARLRYTVRRSGHYRVVANSYRPGRYGPYTVRVSEASSLPTSMHGVRGTIARGEMRTATLSRGDATVTRITGMSITMDRSGRSTISNVTSQAVEFHAWLYTAQAGEAVTIELRAEGMDPLLIVQEADGADLERNDDGGGGLNSRLVMTFPAAGTYRIVATTAAVPRYGTYTLTIN